MTRISYVATLDDHKQETRPTLGPKYCTNKLNNGKGSACHALPISSSVITGRLLQQWSTACIIFNILFSVFHGRTCVFLIHMAQLLLSPRVPTDTATSSSWNQKEAIVVPVSSRQGCNEVLDTCLTLQLLTCLFKVL